MDGLVVLRLWDVLRGRTRMILSFDTANGAADVRLRLLQRASRATLLLEEMHQQVRHLIILGRPIVLHTHRVRVRFHGNVAHTGQLLYTMWGRAVATAALQIVHVRHQG